MKPNEVLKITIGTTGYCVKVTDYSNVIRQDHHCGTTAEMLAVVETLVKQAKERGDENRN